MSKKRTRKHMRGHRRAANMKLYRDKARALIARLREHNGKTSVEEDRFDPSSFRWQLRNLRKDFGRVVAGRLEWS